MSEKYWELPGYPKHDCVMDHDPDPDHCTIHCKEATEFLVSRAAALAEELKHMESRYQEAHGKWAYSIDKNHLLEAEVKRITDELRQAQEALSGRTVSCSGCEGMASEVKRLEGEHAARVKELVEDKWAQVGLREQYESEAKSLRGELEKSEAHLLEARSARVWLESQIKFLGGKLQAVEAALAAERDELKAMTEWAGNMGKDVADAEFVVRAGDKDMALKILRRILASRPAPREQERE